MFNVFKSLFTPKEAEQKSPNVIIPLPSDEAGKEAFFHQYIDVLLAHGWKMEPAQASLSDNDIKDYASGALVKAGADVVKFVSLFKTLMKESENVWYNSIEDFSNDSTEGEGCAWNEFAKEDLVRATSEEEKAMIVSFWDNHLPLINSYQGDESTISIVLEGEDRGKIVCCHEGIYDEAEVVATSFIKFLQYHAWCVVEGDAKLWEFI